MRQRDWIAAGLVALALTFAVFALASGPRWAVCITALLSLAAVTPQLGSRRTLPWREPLLVLIALAAGFTAMQLVWLPMPLLSVLAPGKHALVTGNALALGVDAPSFAPISWDPPATAVELAKLGGYLAFSYALLRLAARPLGRSVLAGLVVIIAAAVALTALIHEALGLKELFGVYAPKYGGRLHYLAPLLNENHLSGLLAMVTPVAVALAVADDGRRKALWCGATALTAGVALLSMSRGGAVALVLGLLLLTIFLVLQRRRTGRDDKKTLPAAVAVPAAAVILCAIVLLLTFTAGGVRGEFARTGADELSARESKIGLWRESIALIGDSLWVGIGRGAFEQAITHVHGDNARSYSHVENETLQATIDWGIPAMTALLLALGWVLARAVGNWRAGPIEAGSLAGVIAIGLQNQADFSLELPGVAMPALILTAIATQPALRTVSTKAVPRLVLVRSGALALGLLVVILAASPFGQQARQETLAVQRQLRAQGAGHADSMTVALEAFRRHPADFVAPALVAQALFAQRDPRAVTLANRALAANPQHAELHFLVARMLEQSQQPEQSLIEFRLAISAAPQPRPILEHLLARFPERAAEGMPLDLAIAPRLVAMLASLGRNDIAERYAAQLTTVAPQRPEAHILLAEAAARGKSWRRAADAAAFAYRLRPAPEPALLRANAELALGNAQTAVAVLSETIADVERRGGHRLYAMVMLLARAASAAGDLQQAKQAAERAKQLAGADRQRRIQAHLLLARIQRELGNRNQATWEEREAAQLRDGLP